MDNLTHSLAGALLGQLGLKRNTALAMPTLIIAANIPDIDAYAVLLGGHQHLGIRRGITHGPMAMIVLPLLLTGAMLFYDRWRRRKAPDRPTVHTGWLIVLAAVGTISHPALDWLNNYGVRFLEPFASSWFYGDSIFIIDVWIWIALAGSMWLSILRERRGQGGGEFAAWFGFAAICGYIFLNVLITDRAERHFRAAIEPLTGERPTLVVANAVPVQFWKREMAWRNGRVFGSGWYSLFEKPFIRGKPLRHHMDHPRVQAAIRYANADARAYLFWSRMPIAEVESDGTVVIRDQRFMDPRVADRFMVRITPKS
jgi:inner membrane protein